VMILRVHYWCVSEMLHPISDIFADRHGTI
jgi:hypothetical protein